MEEFTIPRGVNVMIGRAARPMEPERVAAIAGAIAAVPGIIEAQRDAAVKADVADIGVCTLVCVVAGSDPGAHVFIGHVKRPIRSVSIVSAKVVGSPLAAG